MHVVASTRLRATAHTFGNALRELVRRFSWCLFPLALFALSRAALLLCSKIGMQMSPGLFYAGGPREWLAQYPSIDGLCRWDCGMYERLAREGHWDAGATNFLPGFPLLARGLSELTGMHLHLALIVVPNLASLIALLVLYRLFTRLEGEPAARWALTLFVCYPFAFFQAAAFPESCMTLLTAIALTLALRNRHIGAGAVLALAFFFKQLSLFAWPGLLAAQLHERWSRGARAVFLSPSVLGLMLPPLSLAAYVAYVDWKFGDPLAFWKVRAAFGPLASWTLLDLARNTDWNPYSIPIDWFVGFVLVLLVPGAIGLWVRRHFALAAFATVHLLVLLTIGLWGLGRYSSSAWPAFLPLGVWLSQRPVVQTPLVVALALCQGVFFFLFSHQFPVM